MRNRTIVVSPFGLTEPLSVAVVPETPAAALVAAVGNVGAGNVVKFSSLPGDEPYKNSMQGPCSSMWC